MTAVFLSYAHADRDFASRVVRELKVAGVDAWWDEEIPGVDWRRALECQIGELGAVVVLWTTAAKDDPAVKGAARVALSAGKLINATAGGASPPFPYGSVDGASLDGWAGADSHAGWMKLIGMIRGRVSPSGDGASFSVGAVKRETESTNSVGGPTPPSAAPDAPKTPNGGESSPQSGAPRAKTPSASTDSEKGRDTHQALGELVDRWQRQNAETALGVFMRRFFAIIVASIALFIGFQMFHNNVGHSSASQRAWVIPFGLLLFARFLWKGWR